MSSIHSSGFQLRTLITGGTGFIGFNLAEHLIASGREVMIVARSVREPMPSCRFEKCDVLDLEGLREVCNTFRPHEIVHLAAESHFVLHDDPNGYRVNTEGTGNLLSVLTDVQGIKRCIIASSHVVDFADQSEAGSLRYVDSKREVERLVNKFPPSDTALVLMRPCSIWGPGFGTPFFEFFQAVSRRRYFHLGDVDPAKRLGYIGNTVVQIAQLLDAPSQQVDRRNFYLADYYTTTIRTWANVIAKKMGCKSPSSLPEILVRSAASTGDLLHSFGMAKFPINSFRLRNMRRDTSNIPIEDIELLTGPLPYSLQAGVERTVDWLKQEGHI